MSEPLTSAKPDPSPREAGADHSGAAEGVGAEEEAKVVVVSVAVEDADSSP